MCLGIEVTHKSRYQYNGMEILNHKLDEWAQQQLTN